ncbi:hypothetical protein [Salegentibacter chungangensis]|uniref:SCO family protein n=1 Tax=Salegentibacter chungangensis TaxID=1335724 RepID=A0ABW3NP95_9FLAO
MKKFIVLTVLFALPIIAYLFFASGKNNFARLPVLTENVKEISSFENLQEQPVSFKNNISVVAFFGSDLEEIKGYTFNLDQEILEKYYSFKDFQFVILVPEAAKDKVRDFVQEFGKIGSAEQWKFVFAKPEEIKAVFGSMETSHSLDENLYSPYVFIIDKDGNLRGRNDDKDHGVLYGYDSRSVAELNNKMNDDVKVILAEYRLALKKYKADRKY